jgi:pyridoxine 5-phosphate synthase
VHDHGDRCDAPAAQAELAKVREAGRAIQALGMQFNAGHALNYVNVGPVAALPGLAELHIGHAIVSRAVFSGLRAAVADMRTAIDRAAGVHSGA